MPSVPEAKERIDNASIALAKEVAKEAGADADVLKAAIDEAKEALTAMTAARGKAKPKPEDQKSEADLTAIIEQAEPILTKLAEDKKKQKEAARKRVMQAGMKAAPFTGDRDELAAAVKEAQECGVPDKEINDASEKLTAIVSFHVMLDEAAKELTKASDVDKAMGELVKDGKTPTLEAKVSSLEESVKEVQEGAAATLKKTVVELFLQLLTKPAPTAVATDVLETTIAEATDLGVDENVIKQMKKRNEESKKAQNAKKIADRKAKKPPADPPKPPDPPEAHPKVQELKTALESAMDHAEAKLLECKSALALVGAKKAELLTDEVLLDLKDRPRGEEHPNIAALKAAVETATAAKVDEKLLKVGQDTLDASITRRMAARTKLAQAGLADASKDAHLKTDVVALTAAIEVAEKEEVAAEVIEAGKAHLSQSYKAQSEDGLGPLAEPEPLTHEGFKIIDPLTKALEEARKRNAHEELLIKGQAKLEFWIEARSRRDKGKKALDASLSPPPAIVDQMNVLSCLKEVEEAKLDPELISAARDKLRVAELTQRLHSKSVEEPGKLDIPALEEELEVIGGGALRSEQLNLERMQQRCEELQEHIQGIKDTQANQKQRDATLSKQKKVGAHKQRPEEKDDDLLLPAWVKRASDSDGPAREEILTVDAAQQHVQARLEEELKEAQAALKEQEAVVKNAGSVVIVPTDVIEYAQQKLKASRACDEMQQAQVPELLDLDIPLLLKAIKACEFKFGELPIAGLDELDCNVPKAELELARTRLHDATRAQARQARARTSLSVRVNAPTGTATFDLLVKLVAEAKAAGVEEDLVARAELKLKKMEELAASSLRAGPLAFISFHLPCLRSCVAQYAISLVEQAEQKRQEDYARQTIAAENLQALIGTWKKGDWKDKTLGSIDVDGPTGLKAAIANAAAEGLSQELIEMGRLKLVMIDKFKMEWEKNRIQMEKEEAAAAAAAKAHGGGGGDGKPKKKFKNYGYVAPKKE